MPGPPQAKYIIYILYLKDWGSEIIRSCSKFPNVSTLRNIIKLTKIHVKMSSHMT